MVTTTASTLNTSPLRAGMRPLGAIDWVALVLVIVGGINWGLIGAANFDLVAAIFGAGTTLSRLVYILVGLSALWMIVVALRFASNRND